MRVRVFAPMIAGVLLASAGVAVAQVMVEIPKSTAAPQSQAYGVYGAQGPLAEGRSTQGRAIPERRYNYLMKVQSLREKTLRVQAGDGGQLTPEHAARLQAELDRLNRVYGEPTE